MKGVSSASWIDGHKDDASEMSRLEIARLNADTRFSGDDDRVEDRHQSSTMQRSGVVAGGVN